MGLNFRGVVSPPFAIACLATLSLAACDGGGGAGAFVISSQEEPARGPRAYLTGALVFNGTGAWMDEVASLESILSAHGVSFDEVTSARLEAMGVDELASYGMIVWPGGSGAEQAASINATAEANIRAAVTERGVSYIGFCAGAFMAASPIGLVSVSSGQLPYYYLENQGTDIAMTLETFPDGSTRDLVWYGGPVTPNVSGSGGVLAKYPTGEPAVSEMWAGQGFLLLSGVHPAAPQVIRNDFALTDTDGLDTELAWTYLSAALNRAPLPSF